MLPRPEPLDRSFSGKRWPRRRRALSSKPWKRVARQSRSGTAIFPISDAHYVEMAKIRSESQRARLAEVMWELSGLTTILSRPSIMRMELDRSLSDLVGPADGLLAPLPLFGFGSAWAFGRVGWRLRSDEEDLTDELGRGRTRALSLPHHHGRAADPGGAHRL